MSPQKSEFRKKVRRIEHLPLREHVYYIFCEETKTEPQYFEEIKKAIERNPIYKNMVQIKVEGVGAETLRVIEAAEEKINTLKLKNAQVWCIYDKDDFSADRFNQVPERVNNLNKNQMAVQYMVGWSNQCIEYWFVLHFAFYDADNDRIYYRRFLDRKFKELGWSKYEKNNSELFNILTTYGNPKLAINYAKQRLSRCSGCTASQSVPATKVHELVEELAKFLSDDIRNRCIDD